MIILWNLCSLNNYFKVPSNFTFTFLETFLLTTLGIAISKSSVFTVKLDTIETPLQFLSKYNQSHLELIKDENYSIRKLASITNLSNNTIVKIRKTQQSL